MLPGMEMLACPNLAVSPEVMQHIVRVESGANPFAIGVVGGQLERQPKNVAEALATVQMLDAKGYNFSVGLAQVNRANLGRYGLDSYEKAFSGCANLSAGAHILADCYTSARGDWGKAFSCYYSGNFTTGFRDGYVQKVYASINEVASRPSGVTTEVLPAEQAIALRERSATVTAAAPFSRQTDVKPTNPSAYGNPNYRVTLRSMAIDAAAAATVPAIVAAITHSTAPNDSAAPSGAQINTVTDHNQRVSDARDAAGFSPVAPNADGVTGPGTASIANAPNESVFVPAVRGPNDMSDGSTPAGSVASPSHATAADRAHIVQEKGDAAFVF